MSSLLLRAHDRYLQYTQYTDILPFRSAPARLAAAVAALTVAAPPPPPAAAAAASSSAVALSTRQLLRDESWKPQDPVREGRTEPSDKQMVTAVHTANKHRAPHVQADPSGLFKQPGREPLARSDKAVYEKKI